MPTIIDPIGTRQCAEESGAILQNLARKMGLFGGDSAGEQVAVLGWLFCQMGGLGAMAGPSQ